MIILYLEFCEVSNELLKKRDLSRAEYSLFTFETVWTVLFVKLTHTSEPFEGRNVFTLCALPSTLLNNTALSAAMRIGVIINTP